MFIGTLEDTCHHGLNLVDTLFLRIVEKKSYSFASIKANIDNAFEEDKIRLWEFEGLKLCSEQISIFSEEVFKQNRVHCAPENKKEHFINYVLEQKKDH